MYKEEIEQLKQALAASPNNNFVRTMLIKKMQHHAEYIAELETLLQEAIRNEPNNIELKSILIDTYFKQDKCSACIVLAEAIHDKSAMPLSTRASIAKCYLRENNKDAARELYQLIVQEDESYEDEELDNAFRMRASTQADGSADSSMFTKPNINFADVGGMDDVKREIDLKIIKPLENAELFASYGKKAGGGILLYGPPGCGKTFIAKATAGQINANFINIGLEDVLDMWHGNSEKNLNKYFTLARRKKPCVIFIDEVDALGAKRSDLRQSGGKNVIHQFLSEMDGIAASNEGVLIIGATNAPWHLDSAFRRPGRFDRIIFVPPPDEKSKEKIIELKLAGKPQEKIDYKKIAKKTPGYSGADINAMIDIAIEKILEEAMNTGIPKKITTMNLLDAAKQHHASTVDWFTTAKNYALFANKSGLYDAIIKYLK